MRRLRILHAPALVIHQQWIVSRAQRSLGHISDVMTFNADRGGVLARDCDINFHTDRNQVSFRPGAIVRSLTLLMRFFGFFIRSLFRYDVFHFHSESFFGSRSSLDLKILKLLRKKIIFQYWGCDIRLRTLSILDGDTSTCDDCIRVCKNSRKLRDNITHLRYADFRVYGGADAIRIVPDALYVPLAVDIDYWKPVKEIPKEHIVPDNGTIRVLHPFENAASRGDQKGTKFIKQAIDELKREGLKIELVFIHDVPFECMKYYYQQADIVVSQLLMGSYGGVSVEAMAMGKPVVCYLNQDTLRLLPKGNPIVNADPKTIKDVLRTLAADKASRDDIGRKSRRYVEEHHDAVKLAQRYIDLYARDWR